MTDKDQLVVQKTKEGFEIHGPSTYVVVALCVLSLASLVAFSSPQVVPLGILITAIAVLTLFMPIIRAAETKMLSTVGAAPAQPTGR